MVVAVEARKIRLVMELRRAGVTDTRVLSAIERVPRERFVPEAFLDRAYDNVALPIGHGQTVSQPLIVALMTQALEVGERMKVLEVGTGSGYQSVVLARLCRRLYTVERHRPLLDEAERRFAELGVHNITARAGDGAKGWPEQAPFDRILVTAFAPEVPETLLDQLAVGGVMVMPLGVNHRDQHVTRLSRGEDGVARQTLWPVRFVPLVADARDSRRRGSRAR